MQPCNTLQLQTGLAACNVQKANVGLRTIARCVTQLAQVGFNELLPVQRIKDKKCGFEGVNIFGHTFGGLTQVTPDYTPDLTTKILNPK